MKINGQPSGWCSHACVYYFFLDTTNPFDPCSPIPLPSPAGRYGFCRGYSLLPSLPTPFNLLDGLKSDSDRPAFLATSLPLDSPFPFLSFHHHHHHYRRIPPPSLCCVRFCSYSTNSHSSGHNLRGEGGEQRLLSSFIRDEKRTSVPRP